jgi:hypothetical protein
MRSLISFLLVSILFACNTQTETRYEDEPSYTDEDINAMHDEVMAIHDEVMPKMEDLFNERQRLTSKLETITDSAQADIIRTSIQELTEADESMMQWMREFNPREFEDDPEALVSYYAKEKERIEDVRTIVITSLENASSR